jgi:hypothetical protein
MTVSKVPTRHAKGAPSSVGGRYAVRPKSTPNLDARAFASPSVFPDLVEFESAWPNKSDRSDRLNERYHQIAGNVTASGVDHIRAAREAVNATADLKGEFTTLPSGEVEAEGYVCDALRSDSKVLAALDAIGRLEHEEAKQFGNRLAGALYDLEVIDRDERTMQSVTRMQNSAPVEEDSAWDYWGRFETA